MIIDQRSESVGEVFVGGGQIEGVIEVGLWDFPDELDGVDGFVFAFVAVKPHPRLSIFEHSIPSRRLSPSVGGLDVLALGRVSESCPDLVAQSIPVHPERRRF